MVQKVTEGVIDMSQTVVDASFGLTDGVLDATETVAFHLNLDTNGFQRCGVSSILNHSDSPNEPHAFHQAAFHQHFNRGSLEPSIESVYPHRAQFQSRPTLSQRQKSGGTFTDGTTTARTFTRSTG